MKQIVTRHTLNGSSMSYGIRIKCTEENEEKIIRYEKPGKIGIHVAARLQFYT